MTRAIWSYYMHFPRRVDSLWSQWRAVNDWQMNMFVALRAARSVYEEALTPDVI